MTEGGSRDALQKANTLLKSLKLAYLTPNCVKSGYILSYILS